MTSKNEKDEKQDYYGSQPQVATYTGLQTTVLISSEGGEAQAKRSRTYQQGAIHYKSYYDVPQKWTLNSELESLFKCIIQKAICYL